MSEAHYNTLRDSIAQATAASSRQAMGLRMFEVFFARFPEAQRHFDDTYIPDFAAPKFKYVSDVILDSVRNPYYATYQMVSEVMRHNYLDVQDAPYFYAMIDSCQQAVADALGSNWTPELSTCWDESTQAAKGIVQAAIKEARR